MEILLWFVFEVLFSGALEFLFELNDAFNKTRELRSAALVWFIILGTIAGVVTGFLAPRPVLAAGPFPGVQVVEQGDERDKVRARNENRGPAGYPQC